LKWSEIEYPWQVCFEEAWRAYCAGSLPIGAALFSPTGELLFRGRNHINDTEPDGRIVKGTWLTPKLTFYCKSIAKRLFPVSASSTPCWSPARSAWALFT